MGIEKIKQKILADAKKETDDVFDEAKKEAKVISDDSKLKLDEFRAKREKEIQSATKLLKDKTLAQARLDSKRQILGKRHEIVEAYISEALVGLHKSKNYVNYIKMAVDECKKYLEGSITFISNKKDQSDIKKIIDSGDKVEVKPIEGGLIAIDNSGKRIDFTINSRLSNVRQEIYQKIVKEIGL